jgi:hypothetical protein
MLDVSGMTTTSRLYSEAGSMITREVMMFGHRSGSCSKVIPQPQRRSAPQVQKVREELHVTQPPVAWHTT